MSLLVVKWNNALVVWVEVREESGLLSFLTCVNCSGQGLFCNV